MKILTRLAGVCLCLFLSVQLFAQDVIQTNLTANPVLTDKWNELQAKGFVKAAPVMDTIPFLDDFSYPGPYPNPAHWQDNLVFINRTYAYSPPTIGVATFDGLNEKGYPYNFLASQNSSALADSLTSNPIDLEYPVDDSIYFSFYYQPQGRGNSPASKDSLVLEFKSPDNTSWDHIWSKTGSTITFKDTLNWKLVMIPITNSIYLKKGFQFRFKNYATVSGNLDHWHIDYVYLNRLRKITDTDFQDVSYVYDHPSLIKNYQVMPWKQYTPAFSQTSIVTLAKNNESKPKNVGSIYRIKDKNGTALYTLPGSKNVGPFSQDGYYKIKYKFDTVPGFVIPALTGPTSYFVEAILSSPPDIRTANDTLRHEQKFGNYFAYDDGTAETAFGLTKPNAELAIKFELNVTDTLRYVDIYFNPILTDASLYTFNLKVWADGGGVPGTELFTSGVLKPRYSMGGVNTIIRYGLNTSLILNPGVFYVGFIQSSNSPLNVGMDLNTNNQYNTFYNVGTGWNTMPIAGSAILHPVFGSDSTVISVSEIDEQKQSLAIYPNPAVNDLHVRMADLTNQKVTYSIIDVFGREVENKTLITPATIDITNLSKGIYFIRMDGDKISSTFKFIKIE
jgi:hypothetical protein